VTEPIAPYKAYKRSAPVVAGRSSSGTLLLLLGVGGLLILLCLIILYCLYRSSKRSHRRISEVSTPPLHLSIDSDARERAHTELADASALAETPALDRITSAQVIRFD